MSQSIFIECPNCHLEFHAEEWCDGECPDCGNEYEWHDAPDLQEDEADLIWSIK